MSNFRENKNDDGITEEPVDQQEEQVDTKNAVETTGASVALAIPSEVSKGEAAVRKKLGVPNKQTEALSQEQRNAIRKRLEGTDVQSSVVRAFEGLSLDRRIEILALVRASGSDFNQKQLPVLTGLLTVTIGAYFVAVRTWPEWGWLVPAVLVVGSMIKINAVGKSDARREASFSAWVKALEEADSRANKQLEK